MRLNKKAQLGNFFTTTIVLIVFVATYPFMQSAFSAASGVHTGFLATAIDFIPFLVLFFILKMLWNLDGGGAQG